MNIAYNTICYPLNRRENVGKSQEDRKVQLSKRALAVQGSVTLQIDTKAKEMKAQGIDVVSFGAGEPDFPTPLNIRKAAVAAMEAGKTVYTPVPGEEVLRKAICEKLEKDNGLVYAPQDIVVSNGAKHALFNCLQVLIDPGDEVLIPSPCWVSYPELTKMAGGIPVFVPGREENGFKVTAEEIRGFITPKTKALILNSPNNPNGYVYTREELAGIAELAVETPFYVISDEIYEFIIYDGAQHVSIASLGDKIKEQTIVVNGVSKTYAMTGWRIGYTASARQIASVISRFQSQATSNANSIAQHASVEALRGPHMERDAMVAEFAKRRKHIITRISNIPPLSAVEPKGAFYVMMKVSGLYGKKYQDREITDSMSLADLLLTYAHVAIVPGKAFDAPEFCRLSYATSIENIDKGLDRIRDFIAALR